MGRYLLVRLGHAVLVVVGVSLIVFLLTHLGGDPASLLLPPNASEEDIQQFRHAMGFDQPLPIQLVAYLARLAHGDFGQSFRYGQPALEVVLERVGATLVLILSAPPLRGLPAPGGGALPHLVLPGITLAAYSLAIISRLLRSSLLEVLGADYVRTARAKGLRERAVLVRHALKNALLPVTTVLGLQVGTLLGGAVITEEVFAYPGMGRLAVQAILGRDFALIQAFVILTALTIVVTNLLVDLAYGWLDPRVRLQR